MRLNSIKVSFSVMAISMLSMSWAQQQEIDVLCDLGLEDVRVIVNREDSYISYEDNVSRGSVTSIDSVIEALHKVDSLKSLNVLVMEGGVPKLSVYVPIGGDISVSYDTNDLVGILKGVKRENRGFGKLDIVFYPELFLENSWLDKLYGVAVNISPAIQLTLWPGAMVAAQVVIPVYTNMLDEKRYVRPGIITLSQNIRLHNQLYGTVTVGNFTDSRMGVDVKINYYTANGNWNLGARMGVTGSSTFYDGDWRVSMWRRVTWSGWGSYFIPKYCLELRGEVLQMVYGDCGVRATMQRYFRDVSVGLYAMCTGGYLNGGFNFSVPFPGQRRPSRRRGVRVTYPEYFTRVYSALNDKSTLRGYSYETTPYGGGLADFYNPYYIKRYILD